MTPSINVLMSLSVISGSSGRLARCDLHPPIPHGGPIMRVFITGASGHIGSAVMPELLQAGHQVTGLARSDRSADALTSAGAEVRHGDLDDLDGLREAALGADGVIHLVFNPDAMRSGVLVPSVTRTTKIARKRSRRCSPPCATAGEISRSRVRRPAARTVGVRGTRSETRPASGHPEDMCRLSGAWSRPSALFPDTQERKKPGENDAAVPSRGSMEAARLQQVR